MLWITNIASKEARENFLDILVELCIVRRKLIFAVLSDQRDFAENVSLKFLNVLESVWNKEENEKWKNMLDPNILRFCDKAVVENKLSYKDFEKTIFLKWKRFSSLVKYVLLCLHQHPVKCNIVISVLKIMMKAFVYPTVIINFASEIDVPDCQVTRSDLERAASAHGMSPATLEMLCIIYCFLPLIQFQIESLLELYGVRKSNIAKLHSLGPKTLSNLQTEEKTHDFLKAFLLSKMAEHTTRALEEKPKQN